MGVLGFGASNVNAVAVATLAPGQVFCNGPPIGLCAKNTSGPNYGYTTIGEWIASDFNDSGSNNGGNGGGNDDTGLTGSFRWIDFTPNAGGTDEVREELIGNEAACGIRVGDNVREQGNKQGAKSAYNTRFGFYPHGANGYTSQTAPPDRTGYSYPSKSPGPNIAIGTSAYSDYRAKQGTNTPFTSNQYAPSGAAGNIPGDQITSADHREDGTRDGWLLFLSSGAVTPTTCRS